MIAQITPAAQAPATAACARCVRCGRTLTNPKSAERGMGRWCAKKAAAAQLAQVQAEEAAAPAMPLPGCDQPAQAPAIAPIVALNKSRRSAKFPGLTYEIRTTERGHYLVFSYGAAFDGYALADGRAAWVDCSDRGVMPGEVSAYCKAFAGQLAAHLARGAA